MRVVALTVEASLGVALSMMDDWEVVAAKSIEDAIRLAPTAAVILVGMGGTDEGLAVAQEIYGRGATIPSVVVGDTPAPSGSLAPVVCRPFSLDDLRGAIDAAMRSAGGNGAAAPASAPAASAPVAEQPERTSTRRKQPRDAKPEPEPEPEAETLAADAAAGLRIIDLQHERTIHIEPEEGEGMRAAPKRAAEPPGAAAPPPSPPPPVASPPAQQQAQRAYGEEPRRRSRRKAHRAAEAREVESPLMRKMRAVASAGADLEDLLAELPMLSDLASMTSALLGEVVEIFGPEVGSVYVRSPKGFRVAAAHGLSKVERGLVVHDDHPLFGQMLQKPEAVLISPVDLAQGLVAGIGGARTEALLVAPVEVDGHCVAIIVVGRDGFDDPDLDRLDDLAHEAAPGIAVALMLDRIRSG